MLNLTELFHIWIMMYRYGISFIPMGLRLLYLNLSENNGWLMVSLHSLPKEDAGPDLEFNTPFRGVR